MTHSIFRVLSLPALALVASLSAAQAVAETLIDNDTGGMYNVGIGDMADYYGPDVFPGANVSEGDPTNLNLPEPNVFGPAFGVDWLNADYTGGSWDTTSNIPNTWAVNTEMAVVYDFSLASTSSLRIRIGADNSVFVWLDGDYLLGATAPGGAVAWEYDVYLPSVGAGAHALQLILADHGSASDFLVLVEAERVAEVPLPGTLALLGIGLGSLGLMRKRSRPGS